MAQSIREEFAGAPALRGGVRSLKAGPARTRPPALRRAALVYLRATLHLYNLRKVGSKVSPG